MPHRNMRLGQAMAYVGGPSNSEQPKAGYLPDDSEVIYIESLEHKIRRIRKHGDAISVIESHAGQCCDKHAGIDDDETFFLSCLVVGEESIEQPKGVPNFMAHLNDCYACFSAFSEVFRDYYQQRLKLAS